MLWHAGDAGDTAIKAAFEEIVAPAMHKFAPDIILVSCSKHIHASWSIACCLSELSGTGSVRQLRMVH